MFHIFWWPVIRCNYSISLILEDRKNSNIHWSSRYTSCFKDILLIEKKTNSTYYILLLSSKRKYIHMHIIACACREYLWKYKEETGNLDCLLRWELGTWKPGWEEELYLWAFLNLMNFVPNECTQKKHTEKISTIKF